MQKSIILILMGVCGTGKTTIGKLLSERLAWPYFEGDAYHPAPNVEKMRQGIPLNDQDRMPWLHALRQLIEEKLAANTSAILACSALKDQYRQILKQENEEVIFVYLQGSFELIAQRLQARQHEYMPDTLLKSQFEALEEPQDAMWVSITSPIEEVIEEIITQYRAKQEDLA